MEENEFPFQAQSEQEMQRVREQLNLAAGDIYEDCAYHPVLCVNVDYTTDDIQGISLVDGTHPRSCSLRHCGIRKLTVEEAWHIRQHGPHDPAARESIAAERRWWRG
ncbi:hypothetical protein ACS5PN_30450 [Roseateles sp. NT4]|uniref:hypothetical protein n=1 Tax=Roseateles sp. NT4 TaxID=3453715 RepID=UPI003EEEF696